MYSSLLPPDPSSGNRVRTTVPGCSVACQAPESSASLIENRFLAVKWPRRALLQQLERPLKEKLNVLEERVKEIRSLIEADKRKHPHPEQFSVEEGEAHCQYLESLK